MPNQRKKGKRLVAGWLESGDAEEFDARAKELGITKSALITLLVREELKRMQSINRSPNHGNGLS